MTFGVVLLSLLGQGLTMGPLLRALKIVGAHAERHAYERLRGGLRASRAVLEAQRDRLLAEHPFAELMADIDARALQLGSNHGDG